MLVMTRKCLVASVKHARPVFVVQAVRGKKTQ